MPDPLAPDSLRRTTDPATLPFETTSELEPLDAPLGQARAIEALEFGTSLRKKGYHVYAMGEPGAGRRTLVYEVLSRRAAREPLPPDICYVHNFDDPRSPRVLRLPAGRAVKLRDDMARFGHELRAAIPAAFESDEYRTRREAIEAPFKDRGETAVDSVATLAAARSIAFEETDTGFQIQAMKDGEKLSDEEAEKLPEAEKQRLDEAMDEVGAQIEQLFDEVPRWQKDLRDAVRVLDRQTVKTVVDHHIEDVRRHHDDLPEVKAFLDRVYQDLLEELPDVVGAAAAPSEGGPSEPEAQVLSRCRINVLVEHGGKTGAPVVVEDHPTISNLFGRIEHVSRQGALSTDFALIKAGSLHRASGGYLIVDVEKLIETPNAWDQLKRAFRAQEVRMEIPDEIFLAQGGAVSLTPEPIPFDVKIVFVGERATYYVMAELDRELDEHVKVIADFEDDVPRTAETELAYARLCAKLIKQKSLRPFDRTAVARAIERAAERAEDAYRLTTNLRWLADLLVEADHHAELAGRDVVVRADVEAALEGRASRAGRLRAISLEQVRNGIVTLDVNGSIVGQINALAVISLGDFAFGRASRVTCRVRVGRGQVVDIDREVALTGPIHSKGVLILQGYLGGTYGHDHPLSVAASLVFEQNYEGIEGDSASLAELLCLLSALADIPVRQQIAVTGAIDQRGRVQAVGGLNEKIEGFYDSCRELGGVDGHAVAIPASNVRHLMLRPDVVEAARAGRFQVIPVTTVDEAIELVTGVPAGRPSPDGRYPDGSFHARVATRLRGFAKAGGGALG